MLSDRVLHFADEEERITVYFDCLCICGMWWFLVYYVYMQVPPGLVETSFVDGVIRVGDQTHVVEEDHDIACVQNRGNILWFTLEENNIIKT